MAREFARSFYKSKGWHDSRGLALIRDGYLCARCGKPAEEVHHIVPLSPSNIGDPKVTLCLDNLICLCHECHVAAHNDAMAADGLSFDENGQVVQFFDPPR